MHLNKGEMSKAVESNDLVKKEKENEGFLAFKECHGYNELKRMSELTP